jgi:hypothetical protein
MKKGEITDKRCKGDHRTTDGPGRARQADRNDGRRAKKERRQKDAMCTKKIEIKSLASTLTIP